MTIDTITNRSQKRRRKLHKILS